MPIGTTCCGTAGDRGLLHPEQVVLATREIRSVLNDRPAEAYLSANGICEMGLRHATGRPYESFVFLLEEMSRPVAGRPEVPATAAAEGPEAVTATSRTFECS